jgi:hypothetical protein
MAVFGLALLSATAGARGDILPGGTGVLNGSPVSAYVERGFNNQTISVGFKMSGAAVRNPGPTDTVVVLSVPFQSYGYPFRTLSIDWNAHGHPPAGIYTVPHFDFHFYYITENARQAVVGAPTTADPGPSCRPTGYGPPAATVPRMGGHSFDSTAPEFNGKPLGYAFLYGFVNLQEAFVEPVASQAFLVALRAPVSSPVRQPKYWNLPTFPALVPTNYQFSYDAGKDQYTISIGPFNLVPPPPISGVELCTAN